MTDGYRLMDRAGECGGSPSKITLEVVSDAICPWCFVGKRQLDRALATLRGELDVTVRWRPFELNPQMPREGIDRRSYRIAKFGSWEASQRLDAQVADAGRQVGIEFRHDRMRRTPNTLDAHRLVRLAGQEGLQDAVLEALFAAYFTDGLDIGDREVLADLGAAAGLDRAAVATMLAGDAGIAEVRREEEEAHRLGVAGVPTVMTGGRVVFSGALRAELMAAKIRAAAGLPAGREKVAV